MEWSGCRTVSYVRPVRIRVKLGDLSVDAMVDTGSDFDAIDLDLVATQSERGNRDLVRRDVTATQPVAGFANMLEQSTSSSSE